MIMKKIFQLLFLLPFFALAQPSNNDCNNATIITDLNGGCVTVNNTGATFDSYTVGCLSYTNNIWFAFTAQGNFANITVNGVNRPQFAVSTSISGNPCNLVDAVGVGCYTGSGNWSSVTGNLGPINVGQTYYIQVVNNTGGGGGSGNVQLCIDNPPQEPGDVCSSAAPFCSDSPETFPANTNTISPTGPAYGCLLSRPNPAWFFLEIDEPGDIDITLTSNPPRDIDFIVWGPFSDLEEGCSGGINLAGNIVDCSYAPGTGPEFVNIPATQTGEVYVLLITNFSGLATDVTATQTGGSGSTNCDILSTCSSTLNVIQPTCNNPTGTIEVTATDGTPGFNVSWTGPSTGDPIGTEITSLNGTYTIQSLTTGVYTVTVIDNNDCISTTNVIVDQLPQITIGDMLHN